MKSLDAVTSQLKSPAWWLGVILAGFLLNLCSSYARDWIDWSWVRWSRKRSERSKKSDKELQAEATMAQLGGEFFPAWAYLYGRANSEAIRALAQIVLSVVALGLALVIYFLRQRGIGIGAVTISTVALLSAIRSLLLTRGKMNTADRMLQDFVRKNAHDTKS